MPTEVFGNSIRFRVNGILQDDDAILLVQLQSPVTEELVWMPPGGGLEFGESMEACLHREFAEETGLKIEVREFAFFNELICRPYHAVEAYFEVRKTGGTLQLGTDPELADEDQLLKDLRWIPINKLREINCVPEQLKKWKEL